jgi:hypothetical protein
VRTSLTTEEIEIWLERRKRFSYPLLREELQSNLEVLMNAGKTKTEIKTRLIVRLQKLAHRYGFMSQANQVFEYYIQVVNGEMSPYESEVDLAWLIQGQPWLVFQILESPDVDGLQNLRSIRNAYRIVIELRASKIRELGIQV